MNPARHMPYAFPDAFASESVVVVVGGAPVKRKNWFSFALLPNSFDFIVSHLADITESH